MQADQLGARLARAFTDTDNPVLSGTALPALAAQAVASASGREFPAMITIWAAQAAGQPNSATLAAGAAWFGLYLAAKVLDDIQDGHVGLLPPETPAATGINVALALIFAAQSCLAETEDDDTALRLRLAACAGRYALQTVAGQQMGLEPAPDREHLLEYVWRQAGEKGGRPFAMACRLGALSVSASSEVTDGLEQFGMLIGEAVQATDDGVDLSKASSRELCDPLQSLATAYGFAVADDNDLAHLRLLTDESRRDEAGALDELKRKLVEMGALRYLAVETGVRMLRARSLLARLEPCLNADGRSRLWTLTDWLESQPVQRG